MDYSPGSDLRGILNKEFQEDDNKWFRDWYFNKYSHEELMKFKDKYYEDLEREQKLTYFVKWFLNHHINEISKTILVIQKTWNTKVGKTIKSPFPPEQAFSLNKEIEATAYGSLNSLENISLTVKEFNALVKLQNYANTYLVCLGDQFLSLERELISLKETINQQMNQQRDIMNQLSQLIKINQEESCSFVQTNVPMIQPPIQVEGFKWRIIQMSL